MAFFLIEDAAEAHGAEYKGKKCGSFGDITCFSFYGNKILTTGEGGMFLTNKKAFYKKAKKLRDMHHSKKRFVHDGIGYNYRMTNLQAALGCGEIENIEKNVNKKLKIAKLYEKLLKEIPGISLPTTKNYAKNVYWMYAILVDPNTFGVNRDILREKLRKKGIGTRDFFYPPGKQPILKKYLKKTDKFPVTEDISTRGLYLPTGLAITEKQIGRVAEVIKEVYKENLKK